MSLRWLPSPGHNPLPPWEGACWLLLGWPPSDWQSAPSPIVAQTTPKRWQPAQKHLCTSLGRHHPSFWESWMRVMLAPPNRLAAAMQIALRGRQIACWETSIERRVRCSFTWSRCNWANHSSQFRLYRSKGANWRKGAPMLSHKEVGMVF